MTDEMDKPVSLQHYNGPQKPEMPAGSAIRTILPLRVLAAQTISLERANCIDHQFLKTVTSSDVSIPEFNGFNTRISREQGQAVQPETRAVFTPLIDMVLSHLIQ